MRPFRVEVPDEEVADLRRRLRATRWTPQPPAPEWERGVPVAYLRELATTFAERFDWRAVEAELNRYPQFLTRVDGADVHVLHARSVHPGATPLVLTHGWPSSVVEFLDVLGPLVDPPAYGGDAADAFDVVVPSLPGYGFSGPLRDTGWTLPRVADAWAELMARLGYERYVAAGGDFGSVVSVELGRRHPDHVLGVHSSMLVAFPSGEPGELDDLDDLDRDRLARLEWFGAEGSGYRTLMSSRPSTTAHAFTDSAAGLLAWIVERFKDWTDPFDSEPGTSVAPDRILATAAVYWFTRTVDSAAQLYYEDAHAGTEVPEPMTVPLGVAVFPADCVLPLRRLAERDFPSIVRWSDHERGGHFPALEVPDLLVGDLRGFVRDLRA